MKLRTLAVAVALASVPFAAQAEFKVGGDVGVGYFGDKDGNTAFGGNGSEVTFDASQEVNGLTYFGHFEVNVADATINSTTSVEDGDGNETGDVTAAGQLSSDDMYVGVKGGFGTIKLGDTDNGCDTVDTGWVASDVFLGHGSGGCAAGDQNNITYSNTSGAISYAVSFSPEVDTGSVTSDADTFAMGIKGSFGPAAVSLGYETESSNGANVVLGVSGNLGPVAVGIRASKADDQDDAQIGYTANYEAGNNILYVGLGDTTDGSSTFLGYQRKVGSNTRLVAEFTTKDANAEDEVAIAMKHSF